MEVNVTAVMTHNLADYSNSVARSGLANIGQVTWQNAVEAIEALDAPLVPSEGQEELRSWISEFGAWDDEEIEAMSDAETSALLLQMVAGDGQEYLEAEAEGRLEEWYSDCGGRLYKGDDGSWYFYVGM